MFGIAQYGEAYRSGSLTPNQVIADHIGYAKKVSQKCNAISVLNPKAEELAEASAERFSQGKVKGPLDGVPVVVKDSYHMKGLKRWHGSAIHDGDDRSADAIGRRSPTVRRARRRASRLPPPAPAGRAAPHIPASHRPRRQGWYGRKVRN